MTTVERWTIPGSDDQPIFGNTHRPSDEPRGTILIAHGFKGYKDYGMFPRIAREAAGAGWIAHRFNFSHSGMTDNTDTFERPDLFERDTWNRQVLDYRKVIEAVERGDLAGGRGPVLMFGHSRGGVTALLTAGRMAGDDNSPRPAGVITAASPSRTINIPPDQQEALLEQGWLASPSSRTGQDLRVGRATLTEVLEDPEGHDLLALTARIDCPILVIHGTEDPTVPAACAQEIAGAATDGRVLLIEDANHVFNTPNPLPEDTENSPALQTLVTGVIQFADGCVA